jgi:pheromone shutdown protein TraB
MAAQTDRHRQERDVVAVVGIGHLDELAAALES